MLGPSLRSILVLSIALGGCAATAQVRPRTTPARARASEQDEMVRELETRVELAEAEANQLRTELADARRQTTRIGSPREERAEEPWPEPREDRGPRPVLRLYGPPPSNEPPPMFALAPPPGTFRLPVTLPPGSDPEAGVPPIPALPVPVLPSSEPPTRTPIDDAGAAAYRAALARLSARRFDEALAGLDGFLRRYPRHPYADNALYWRGEIHYARRDYRSALASFSALLERYPSGNKLPEALLRVGLCYQRMGERDRARRVFERLRTLYPNSVAARMASREDV